jgi:hypothetical protein
MALPIIALTSLIGYYLNKSENPKIITDTIPKEKTKNKPFPYEKPNGNYIYSSDMVDKANTEILNKSLDLYKQAENPAITGILPPLFNTYGISGNKGFFNIEDLENKQSDIYKLNNLIAVNKPEEPELSTRPMFLPEIKYKGETVNNNFSAFDQQSITQEISLLTGKPLETQHNNMIPFFGSNVKQNIEKFTNETILDLHSGNKSTFQHKREIGQLFSNKPENIYGSPIITTELNSDRFIPSVFREGEKPFQEQRISAPISGTFENKILPSYKDVNELRPGNKPKETYEGRTLSGKMGEVRGVQSEFNKNRPDTYYEQGQDRWIVTTGKYINPKADEDFKTNLKATSRQDNNIEYFGIMGSKDFLSTKQRIEQIDNSKELNFNSLAQIPKRQNFENDYLRNVSNETRVHDYGKTTMTAFATERNTTEERTHLLNVTLPNRGIKTSFSDLAKSTIKETTLDTDTTRNFKSSFDKGAVATHYYGISDFTAKTTNKETIKEDNYKGIVNKESGMGYIVNKYDPRTTGKEIISQNSEYQGGAKYANNPMSNENYLNAELRDNKEELLKRDRLAGPQNFQISSGKGAFGDIKVTENMILKEKLDRRDKLNILLPNILPSKNSIGISDRVKLDDESEDTMFADRLQPDLISYQLKDNPYSMYNQMYKIKNN